MSEPERRDSRLVQLAEALKCISLDELLDAAIDRIPAAIQGRYVSLHLLDDDGVTLKRERANHDRPAPAQVRTDDPRHLVLEVFRTGAPILIPDIVAYVAEQGLPVELDRRTRLSSGCAMLVPICARVPPQADISIIGALEIADKSDFSAFGKDDLRFAGAVADQLGEAIVNTRIIQSKAGGQRDEIRSELDALKSRLDKQQAITSGLEEARRRVELLLPTLPTLPDVQMCVRYRSLETLAGEFYDCLDLGGSKLALVLGEIDVSGVEAALVVAMTKQVLGVCAKTQSGPAAALVRAHHELRASLGGARRVDAQLAVIDRARGLLRLACGGAGAPLLARGGVVRALEPTGGSLGQLNDDAFARALGEVEYPLEAGDQLLLYSSGAIGAAPEGGVPFGRDRLVSHFAALAGAAPDAQVAALAHMIRAHSDSVEGAETWTLLAVHYVGAPAAVDAPLDFEPLEDDFYDEGGDRAMTARIVRADIAPGNFLDAVADDAPVVSAAMWVDAADDAVATDDAVFGDEPSEAAPAGEPQPQQAVAAEFTETGDVGATPVALPAPSVASVVNPPQAIASPPQSSRDGGRDRPAAALAALLNELRHGRSLAGLDPVALAMDLARRDELTAECGELAARIEAEREALALALGIAYNREEPLPVLVRALNDAVASAQPDLLASVVYRLAAAALAPR